MNWGLVCERQCYVKLLINGVEDSTLSSIKLESIMKSSFLHNCYEWLFSEEERRPLGFILIFFMTIIISISISLIIVAVDRHVQGWVSYLFN